MRYENIKQAVFLDRPNRFIANIEIDGQVRVCHVKNTGRCKELLIPGASIFVQDFGGNYGPTGRKTRYDLISVYKGQRLINMDSQVPNKVFREWLDQAASGRLESIEQTEPIEQIGQIKQDKRIRQAGLEIAGLTTGLPGDLFKNIDLIRPETTFGDSRFDFYIEAGPRKIFVEVKGVTLEEEGIARFPDAPTERGIKHLKGLKSALSAGYEAYVVFIIQMKDVRYFEPNWKTHAAFGEALREVAAAGVKLLAIDCVVTPDSISAGNPVEIRL